MLMTNCLLMIHVKNSKQANFSYFYCVNGFLFISSAWSLTSNLQNTLSVTIK